MSMSKSELQRILGRLERIGTLSASAGSLIQPSVAGSRRISSSDVPTIWQGAYAWLKAEANRLGWTVAYVEEYVDRRRIKGRLMFIEAITGGNSAQIRRGDGIGFEIAEGEAESPVIHVQKRNRDRGFLVYHEYHFYAGVVYPMYAVLSGRTSEEVQNTGFQERVLDEDGGGDGRTLEQYSWWFALLRREGSLYDTNDAKRTEINRILRMYGQPELSE
jgi:hypothetical protein